MCNLREEILELKRKKGAVILAHYYQREDVQDVADYVGDSYYLSKIAKECKENLIVFCGVRFMAESAKVLSPNKKILMPVITAGCPMAEMVDFNKLEKIKMENPDAVVVCYINSTLELKTKSDICVTSSNAERIIRKINSNKILFLPDKNLGEFISKKVPEKQFILWNGYCSTHTNVKKESIEQIKSLNPKAEVLVHPECEKEIREIGDFIGSTGDMINYASNSNKSEFIVVTEQGVLHEMKKRSPLKKFYVPDLTITCLNMKKTKLEDVYNCLVKEKHEILVDEDCRLKALNCLEKMHEMAR